MEQLTLDATPRRRARKPARVPLELAQGRPIARVALDVAPAHLDRLFEYSVPAKFDESAVVGVRVRVRFAGRIVDGFIVERTEVAQHTGTLSPIQRVNGVPVLTTEVLALARSVADRYAGTLADVLRSAIPTRHATAERAWAATRTMASNTPHLAASATGLLDKYTGGAALGNRVGQLHSATRAVLTVALSDDPTEVITELAGAALATGSVLVVVPDARDVERFAGTLRHRFGSLVHTLQADQGPSERYRSFLDALDGCARVVVGTRAASFAPLRNLALCVIWDDGDESHSEPRSPGWHSREVLALRSAQTDCSFVAAAHSRSVETQRMVESGWARSIEQPRTLARSHRFELAKDEESPRSTSDVPGVRLPHVAWEAVHNAVKVGPVLVQVARSGYVPGIACAACRATASCQECNGPLALTSGHAIASCRWCGRLAGDWTCAECGSKKLRARAIGVQRTGEELGRAFPGVPITVSGRSESVVARVPDTAGIVVATVGAEPIAVNGYCAVLLLDGDSLLARAESRSEEEAVRRWFNAAALARPDGRVVISADPNQNAVQALVRNDPVGWAERELDQRTKLQLPPAVRVVAVTGADDLVTRFVDECNFAASWRVLGPVPVPTPLQHRETDELQVRLLVTSPLRDGQKLVNSVHTALVTASARPGGAGVHVRIDPISVL